MVLYVDGEHDFILLTEEELEDYIVAQMQKDFVTDRQELTETELLDIVSVGRSLLGTMIGNVAYLFGFRQCGVLGGVFAVAGMITPSFLLLCVLTACYSAFHRLAWVEKALVGARPAGAAVIASKLYTNGTLQRRACRLYFMSHRRSAGRFQ